MNVFTIHEMIYFSLLSIINYFRKGAMDCDSWHDSGLSEVVRVEDQKCHSLVFRSTSSYSGLMNTGTLQIHQANLPPSNNKIRIRSPTLAPIPPNPNPAPTNLKMS